MRAHDGPGYASASVDGGRQLRLRRRLRRRVPRLPLQLQRRRLRAARHGSRRQARPPRRERARRRRDGRPGRARRAGRDRGAPQRARPLPRSPLGRRLPRRGRVARLLAEEARLPRRVARPPREGREARGRLGRGRAEIHLPRPARRPRAARAPADAELARAPVPADDDATLVRRRGPAYLAALLAVDTQVGCRGQLALGGADVARARSPRCGRCRRSRARRRSASSRSRRSAR